MTTLRKIKLYGYVGDCPDKNLQQDVALSLYQENDAQLDVQLVTYGLQAPAAIPTIDDVTWTLYDRSDGTEVFGLSLSDSEVTISDNILSIRLHDTAISGLSGSYYMECNMLIGGYKLTLFTGTAVFVETNVQLSAPQFV